MRTNIFTVINHNKKRLFNMPINPNKGESKDEFTSRCISIEVESGKSQEKAIAICIAKAEENFAGTSSVTDATWSTESPISIILEKISFDYDETLSTDRGMELAKKLISEGNDIYIISARSDKEGMLNRAKELGIPASRVFATGSNRAKVEKINELGIKKHYDNNGDVIKDLPNVGQKFKKVKKVLFNEDFDPEVAKRYKELGFKVYIRSERKIKKRDKKVWNQLKQANLTEDNLVFGNVEQLDRKMNFDLLMTGEDVILEMLSVRGQIINPKRVLKTIPISSIEEAEKIELRERNSNQIKFATLNFLYTYREIPGIPDLIPGSSSRKFCQKLLSQQNKRWTLDEIRGLGSKHLTDMGLPADPFLYRGGFYHNPEVNITTPYCRHEWVLEVSYR